MLKALVWKQFYELFRTYFVNQKSGKRRKPIAVAGLFIMFALLMIVLMGAFFGMGSALATSFAASGLFWLFFAIMAILSVLLGTFGSVFNTYASLYVAKDNEQMLALPIPPTKLLASRLISVYLLSLLYSALVWLPTVLWAILVKASALSIVLSLLLTLIIPIFVSAITCALGWVVALISTKLKNKSIFVALLSIVFFVVYYAFCFRMNDIMNYMVGMGEEVAAVVKVWGFLFYLIGSGASGSVLHFLGFTALSVGLASVVFFVMAKSFVKITTMSASSTKKKEYKEKAVKVSSVQNALLKKEFKRFTSSATYMMNGGFGALVMIALPIIILIKKGDILPVLNSFIEGTPIVGDMIPIGLIVAYCMTTGMDMISGPSISLEGKSLWVLQTLPVQAKDILQAKARLHQMVNVYPAALSIFCVGMLLGQEPDMLCMGIVWVILYVTITSYLGLIIGLSNPNFNWVTETTVIKSGINVLLVMIVDLVLSLLPVLYIPLRKVFEVKTFLTGGIAILLLVSVLLRKWLETKGAAKFEKL